ncbi:uncharacterized protein LOC103573635 [Microplitis demolitor]|uniref:uncharacterized protein LOC103573635 n=1 Tax=Microplitis demolitor TaxID=69319 RepID=UPI00235B5EB4|nr:uncharacterized protein LOC103573635 [Microplitis demolitor]
MFKAGYELCHSCQKPLVNEENLFTLRKRIVIATAGCSLLGGAIGAAALPLLGFGSGGIAAGSFAAAWQTPLTVSGSLFAILQSLGATGMGILLFGATGSVAGGVGALGILATIASKIGWCTNDHVAVIYHNELTNM